MDPLDLQPRGRTKFKPEHCLTHWVRGRLNPAVGLAQEGRRPHFSQDPQQSVFGVAIFLIKNSIKIVVFILEVTTSWTKLYPFGPQPTENLNQNLSSSVPLSISHFFNLNPYLRIQQILVSTAPQPTQSVNPHLIVRLSARATTHPLPTARMTLGALATIPFLAGTRPSWGV